MSLQSCVTVCGPVDCSLPVSSVHRILQAGILEWVAMLSFRGLLDPGIKLASLTSPLLAWASLVAQMVKNLPAMQETQVHSLAWKDPGEGNVYPFQHSCLENSMDRGIGELQFMGSQRVRHN